MSPSFVPLRPPEHEMLPFTVIANGYCPYHKEGGSCKTTGLVRINRALPLFVINRRGSISCSLGLIGGKHKTMHYMICLNAFSSTQHKSLWSTWQKGQTTFITARNLIKRECFSKLQTQQITVRDH